MRGRLMVTTLLLAFGAAVVAPAQTVGMLHIKVVLTDGSGMPQPVARHALLISDNPATTSPRLVRTGADGTVDVRLAPGNYTVESEMPLMFSGSQFEWIQNIDIVAGRDAVLELTLSNAEITSTDGNTAVNGVDAVPMLARLYDSVVAVWTPTTRASGFLIDARGVVVTNQRGVTAAGPLEVQLTPTLKVAAKLLAADAEKDVALLRINPRVAATVPPLSLGCAEAATPQVEPEQRVYAIEAPLRQDKGTVSGKVRAVSAGAIATEITPSLGGSGGPAFAAPERLLGMVSTRGDARSIPEAVVVPASDLCEVFSIAESALDEGPPPDAAQLPVERPVAAPNLSPGAFSTSANGGWPHQFSSSDFDIALITPPMLTSERPRSLPSRGAVTSAPSRTLVDPLGDFSNWTDYVADRPPVLFVRATPKFVEGFWTRVGRAAAYTQGMALPPVTRLAPGFLKLRAFCGDAEVAPVHAFWIEQRVSENAAIHEGFYAFEPGAFAPSCASVRLQLYSEKAPEKGDTVVVPRALVEHAWQELSAFRSAP